jgi:hypothetical protein
VARTARACVVCIDEFGVFWAFYPEEDDCVANRCTKEADDGKKEEPIVPALRSHISWAIEVGTSVSPDAPLADPGVRNYRTGLLRKTRTWNRPGHRVPESIPDASRELDTLAGSNRVP